MKISNKFKLTAMMAALVMAGHASAHVGYGNALYSGNGVYDPLTGTTGTGAYGAAGNFSATVSSNAGYITGLDPNTLGNTHDIRFRYFTLDTQAQVSFTINGLANSVVSGNANTALNGLTPDILNPAFSLYSGVVPSASHDGVGDVANVAGDTDTAAYLASANQFASWSPFVGVNGVRGGAAAGAAGNPTGLWGVFDTNGDITTGNNGAWTATSTAATDTHGPNYLGGLDTPKVATIHYLGISGADAATGSTFVDSLGNVQTVLGADGVVDHSVSWSGILGPGVYTLAIGGANLSDAIALNTDVRSSNAGLGSNTSLNNAYLADRLARNLSITGFTVSSVPLPGAAWLFLSAAMGFLGLNRRKIRA